MMGKDFFVLMLMLVIVIVPNVVHRNQNTLARDSSTSLGMTGRERLFYPTAAITFSSIAIGVGNAVTSIVVRVGFGLAWPAKYSA